MYLCENHSHLPCGWFINNNWERNILLRVRKMLKIQKRLSNIFGGISQGLGQEGWCQLRNHLEGTMALRDFQLFL